MGCLSVRHQQKHCAATGLPRHKGMSAPVRVSAEACAVSTTRITASKTDGMKRLLLLLPMLLFSAAANAAPTHLTCKATKSTDNGVPQEKLYEIPIFIDTENNVAKRWGEDAELRVEPNKLTLAKESSTKSQFIDQWSRSYIEINRTNLDFTRTHTIWTNGSISKIIGKGKCEITPAPAGRQI